MNNPLPLKPILMGLALAMTQVGCGPSEITPPAPARQDAPVTHEGVEAADDSTPRPGPIAPAGPVQPSPVPLLPATTKYDPKQDEAAKPADARPEEKKDEPKAETPK